MAIPLAQTLPFKIVMDKKHHAFSPLPSSGM